MKSIDRTNFEYPHRDDGEDTSTPKGDRLLVVQTSRFHIEMMEEIVPHRKYKVSLAQTPSLHGWMSAKIVIHLKIQRLFMCWKDRVSQSSRFRGEEMPDTYVSADKRFSMEWKS